MRFWFVRLTLADVPEFFDGFGESFGDLVFFQACDLEGEDFPSGVVA